ncbi:Protein unc-80 [Branchiostoma belcheri]|nr:Protein unc-80 [Branchiostoma belcheri]
MTRKFCVKQFYLLHRIPFILQMFGTVAPLLEARHSKEQPMVSAECLFQLVLSLGHTCHDPVNLLGLLEGGRPLQTLDYFYADDPPDMTIIEAINVCITVVAYAADSLRSIQMLCVLEALVPFYMRYLMKQTSRRDSISAAKEELTSIEQLAVSMEALTQSCEPFNRTINATMWRSNDTTGSVNKRKTNALSASKTLVPPASARQTLGREPGKEEDDELKVSTKDKCVYLCVDGVQYQGQVFLPVCGWCSVPRTGVFICVWMVFSTKDSTKDRCVYLCVDGFQHQGQVCLPVCGWCSVPRTYVFTCVWMVFSTKNRCVFLCVDGVQYQGHVCLPVCGWCSVPRSGVFTCVWMVFSTKDRCVFLCVDGVQDQGQVCLLVCGWCSAPRTVVFTCVWMVFSTKDRCVCLCVDGVQDQGQVCLLVCGWCSAPRTVVFTCVWMVFSTKDRFKEDPRRLQYEQNVQSAAGHYEFHRPREAFLNVIVEYFVGSKSRFKHLRRMLDPRFQVPELLSTKSHIVEEEKDMLPIIDWSVPSKRPALVLLLRKLERMFSRIYKRPSLRCHLDWGSATNLLKGVYFTLTKQNIIAHLPQLNLLVTVCVNLLLADVSSAPGEGLTILQMSSPGISALMAPPPGFCAIIIRLAAAQIQFLKNDLTLDQGLRGFVSDPSQEKLDSSMLNLMLPLLIRVGTGNKDIPRISRMDILYAVSTFLGILIPAKDVSSHLQRSGSITASLTSFSLAGDHAAAACSTITPFIAVLGLKILLTCFSKNLTEEWGMLSAALQEFEVAFHPVGTGTWILLCLNM